MKDSLFAMLMSLFEKSIANLREHVAQSEEGMPASAGSAEPEATKNDIPAILPAAAGQYRHVTSPGEDSMRILTRDEQERLTRAGYQLLMRLHQWGFLPSDMLEIVLDQITVSDSRFVGIDEIRWVVRNVMANQLDYEQLCFLDLVLCDKEEGPSLH